MKYLRLLLTLLVLLLPVTTARAMSDDPPTEIPLGNGGSSGEDDPIFRSPSEVPMSCWYYSSTETIQVDCARDLGNVTVSIESLTAGVWSQTVINGTQGSHILLAPTVPGDYEITFTLLDECVYSGLFEIE